MHMHQVPLLGVDHLLGLSDKKGTNVSYVKGHTSFLPVFISSSVILIRHCCGMLKRLRSDGRTPSHLMSGVVRLALSYDMFILPFMYTPAAAFGLIAKLGHSAVPCRLYHWCSAMKTIPRLHETTWRAAASSLAGKSAGA